MTGRGHSNEGIIESWRRQKGGEVWGKSRGWWAWVFGLNMRVGKAWQGLYLFAPSSLSSPYFLLCALHFARLVSPPQTHFFVWGNIKAPRPEYPCPWFPSHSDCLLLSLALLCEYFVWQQTLTAPYLAYEARQVMLLKLVNLLIHELGTRKHRERGHIPFCVNPWRLAAASTLSNGGSNWGSTYGQFRQYRDTGDSQKSSWELARIVLVRLDFRVESAWFSLANIGTPSPGDCAHTHRKKSAI